MKSINDPHAASVLAELKSATAAHDELYNSFRQSREALREIQLKASEVLYGLKIGALVKARDGSVMRVCSYEPTQSYSDGTFRKPWVEANPKKKNGEFGNVRRNLYGDWEIIEP